MPIFEDFVYKSHFLLFFLDARYYSNGKIGACKSLDFIERFFCRDLLIRLLYIVSCIFAYFVLLRIFIEEGVKKRLFLEPFWPFSRQEILTCRNV